MTSEHILIQLAVKADIEFGASELKLFIVYCLLFVCQKLYKWKNKSNYLNSHGEEAQEKPPGL